MKPTIDELRKLADEAKKWGPWTECNAFDGKPRGSGHPVPHEPCVDCEGAQRAVEDIAEDVTRCMVWIEARDTVGTFGRAEMKAAGSARTASYFGSTDNPVQRFADAVKEFCG